MTQSMPSQVGPQTVHAATPSPPAASLPPPSPPPPPPPPPPPAPPPPSPRAYLHFSGSKRLPLDADLELSMLKTRHTPILTMLPSDGTGTSGAQGAAGGHGGGGAPRGWVQAVAGAAGAGMAAAGIAVVRRRLRWW